MNSVGAQCLVCNRPFEWLSGTPRWCHNCRGVRNGAREGMQTRKDPHIEPGHEQNRPPTANADCQIDAAEARK